MYLNDSVAMGGVHEQSLVSAIDKMLPKWGDLPQISRTRSIALETCKDYPGRLHCGGGCMGRAYAAYGNIMMVEDRCELRKAVYGSRP
jgi:radical SAM protein with 4Fe4S-binding SPASM domain